MFTQEHENATRILVNVYFVFGVRRTIEFLTVCSPRITDLCKTDLSLTSTVP